MTVAPDRLRTAASLAEIVAALAIVVSLVYAVTEFRRAQTLSNREVDGLLFERVRESNAMLVETPDLADLTIAAARDPDGMPEPDRLRYLAYRHVFFDTWEQAWDYHQDGILEDEAWREWDAWFAAEARRQPAVGWTGNRHHFTDPEFVRHVDRSVEGSGSGG